MNSITKDGVGNTRLKPNNSLETHLDYLRIRKDAIFHDEFQLLVGFINTDYTVEIDRPWSPGAGAIFFSHRIIGTHGVVGGFNVDEEGFYYLMIDMPGEYFEGKSAVDQWRLLLGLCHRYRVKCTRIDVAIDDPTYSVIPVAEMEQAWRDGHAFGFRNYKKIISGNSPENMDETDYFGGRSSGKMVRCYDHDSECLRFEAEFKRQYAHPVFLKLANLNREENGTESCIHETQEKASSPSNDSWDVDVQKTMASIAVGAIDFRDRGTRKDNRRAGFRDSVRLPFYQQFIDKVGNAHYRIRVPNPAKTISKTLEWVKRQCAPTLAMLAEGFGRHNFNLWVREIVENGSQRMSNQKNLWANEIARNKKLYIST